MRGGCRLPEHRLQQSPLAALAGNHGGDVATVAEDRGPVAHSQHLGQSMCDEEHRPAPGLPLPHHGEDVFRLIGGQGGGDLVEQQQLGVVGQSPGEIEQPQ